MSQVFNPFLKEDEYIPDAEPRIFNDRVYIYGSHDIFNGKGFCLGDYVTYSAPINDLSTRKYEGLIFKKSDDPYNKKRRALYAPDCIKGIDGRYYLYYSVALSGIIGVAVSNFPNGPFRFLSYVKDKNGKILGKRKNDFFNFDPGIYVEEEEVYLYSGFCPKLSGIFVTGGKKVSKVGPMCIKLEKDMFTIKEEPKEIGVKSIFNSKGTAYKGHEFFEASSLRKINDKYYFIYSSILGHELCYAISSFPDKDFKYGGTIISIGDIGLGAIKNKKSANNMLGNTHGSIISINEKHYIFYHRQTNRNCFSRQACAEEIKIEKDGSIKQVEVTSCGLNNGPLIGLGKYEARIACNLKARKGSTFYSVFKGFNRPYFTEEIRNKDKNLPIQFIKNLKNKDEVAFKYFDFKDVKTIQVNISSTKAGHILVFADNEKVSSLSFTKGENLSISNDIKINPGIKSLSFKFFSKGKISFYSFTLS